MTTLSGTAEVLKVFLKLGSTCFGGPIAHIGYFRDEFVTKRKWLTESEFAELVAICQFLPGPASSKVGFSIGLMRAGYPGAVAAWIGFTLPSALALVLFAYGAPTLDGQLEAGLLHGLKLAAVAIVAQAVWAMARALCPDRQTAAIALIATFVALLGSTSATQIIAILLGCFAGLLLCRSNEPVHATKTTIKVSRTVGAFSLALFVILLVGLPLFRSVSGLFELSLFDAFYRSGSLVFGGGHVVLPLLKEAVVAPGWIGENAFLAGYGAAQAIPGPLFTFAAYLGAAIQPEQGVQSATIALVAIFLPGMLILLGVFPFWEAIRMRPSARAAMRGINAAVVGILAAALYDPVWTTAVVSRIDLGIALVGFLFLAVGRLPPLLVVTACAIAGLLSPFI